MLSSGNGTIRLIIWLAWKLHFDGHGRGVYRHPAVDKQKEADWDVEQIKSALKKKYHLLMEEKKKNSAAATNGSK